MRHSSNQPPRSSADRRQRRRHGMPLDDDGRPPPLRELVAAGDYAQLAEIFGPEMLARLLDLERDTAALLAREFPDADADQRLGWTGQLAFVIATDGYLYSPL